MTEIKCKVCGGAKCGACLGTGKSTFPWDQPRNASTVSVHEEDFDRAGVNVRADGRYTKDEIIKALQSRHKALLDLQVESDGTILKDNRGRTSIKGILISWANRQYAANLAAAGDGQ